jgi:acyl-CoA thioesterase-1
MTLCGVLHAAPPEKQQPYTPAADLRGRWAFEADPALPNVLILGDSISIAYTLPVREKLRG